MSKIEALNSGLILKIERFCVFELLLAHGCGYLTIDSVVS